MNHFSGNLSFPWVEPFRCAERVPENAVNVICMASRVGGRVENLLIAQFGSVVPLVDFGRLGTVLVDCFGKLQHWTSQQEVAKGNGHLLSVRVGVFMIGVQFVKVHLGNDILGVLVHIVGQ